ncbi:Glutathione S-transferase omega-1 [Porites harrisoni]
MGHYSKGSEKPPFKDDRLRLYSMRFCPYAQRPRLVLAAKGIDYECVNVNLKDKPDWFLDLNPGGTVPVIEQPDGAVIYESAICCDYLEEAFPDKPQLYPADNPVKKSKQKIIVETIGSAFNTAFYKTLRALGEEEPKEELKKQLSAFDNYLKQNDKHLGGDKPGMGDFLMWPWFERLLVMQPLIGLDLSQFPAVSAWCAAMNEVPAVKECSYPAELHMKFYEGYKNGDPESQLVGIDQKA